MYLGHFFFLKNKFDVLNKFMLKYFNMKKNLETYGKYFLQILFTAIASALVATLQNYIAAHAGDHTAIINPVHTGAIGSIISGGHKTYSHIKTKLC